MRAQELNLHVVSEEEDNLRRLHYWLAYEVSSVGLGGLAFFVPLGPVIMLLKGAAVLFTPYMLWRLFKAGRFGWITGFTVFVVLPFLLGQFLVEDDLAASILVSIIPLATFYIFTCLLRVVVGEWLEELRWKIQDMERSIYRTT